MTFSLHSFCRAGIVAAVAAAAVVLTSNTASACGKCHQNPCVVQPTYQCVTEMVPYTVMKTRLRIDYKTVSHTVMEKVPQTTWVERQKVVCKPVYETSYVQKQVVTCKPVYDTEYVTQCYTVCKPVTTTRQVAAICYQPTTQYVSVPAKKHGCSLCGKAKPACGCITVAQTCYTPVSVLRDVVETQYVQEVQSRQVPVTRCRMVTDVRVENVPVTSCRMVQEVVTEKVPCTTYTCVPKVVCKQIPVPVCEKVPVTKYHKVKRMVECAPAAYAEASYPVATEQSAVPSGQGFASGQN
ncbi:MAG: hypothetical protein U0835_25795 [Isosphaeraceae bacterium]